MTDLAKALKRHSDEVFVRRLWDEVPQPACRGLCSDSCGPIAMLRVEAEILERAAGKPLGFDAKRFRCGYLDRNDRCTAYESRPLICFAPGTLIFAAGGPVPIESVLAGDLVYGHDGRLHVVTATASRHYEGELVGLRHTGLHFPAWTTPDHRWLVCPSVDRRSHAFVPEWKPSGEVATKWKERHPRKGDYLTYPRHFQDGSPLERIELTDWIACAANDDGTVRPFTHGGPMLSDRRIQVVPAAIDLTDGEFLFILGLYLAEGSASIQAVQFTMHAGEEPVLRRVERFFRSLGIEPTVRVQRNTAILAVHSALMGRLFTALGGRLAAGKAIAPRLFASLSTKQLLAVFDGWYTGDGTKATRVALHQATSVSELLIQQMFFVLLRNGSLASVYRGSARLDRQRSFMLVEHNRGTLRGSKIFEAAGFLLAPAADPVRRAYSGPVIDVTVAEAESVVTTAGIAHNCRTFGAAEDLQCGYGCTPTITAEQHAEMFERLRARFGGGIVEAVPGLTALLAERIRNT